MDDPSVQDGDPLEVPATSATGSPPPAPDVLGRPRPKVAGYDVRREMTRGGQAVIYEAIQRSTGRRVVLKVMRSGPLASHQERLRFDREIGILAALDHPHIVSVLDHGQTDDLSDFYAMEYIEGESLDERIASLHRDGRPQPEELRANLDLFIQITEAVEAAHRRGVIHRDLKPANIVIDRRGAPRVLDFGLASTPFLDTRPEAPLPTAIRGHFIGSLPWSSPEQVEDDTQRIDARTDVYALGVILCQIVTGEFPYNVSGSTRRVMNNILSQPPRLPARRSSKASFSARSQVLGFSRNRSNLDPDLQAIVLTALAKSPQDRYATAGALVWDLRRYLDGHRVSSQPPQQTSLCGKLCTVAAALLLLGGIGFTLANLGPAPPPAPPVLGGTITADDGAVELLDRLALPRDIVAGQWKIQDGELVHPAEPSGFGRLRLPVEVQGSYILTVAFLREGGAPALKLILPASGRHVVLTIDGSGRAHARLGSLDSSAPRTKFTPLARLENNRPHVISARVTAKTNQVDLACTLNGQPFVSWAGARDDLAPWPHRVVPRLHSAALESGRRGSGRFRIQGVSLQILDGHARPIRRRME